MAVKNERPGAPDTAGPFIRLTVDPLYWRYCGWFLLGRYKRLVGCLAISQSFSGLFRV
jgi:hypothetical protein